MLHTSGSSPGKQQDILGIVRKPFKLASTDL